MCVCLREKRRAALEKLECVMLYRNRDEGQHDYETHFGLSHFIYLLPFTIIYLVHLVEIR